MGTRGLYIFVYKGRYYQFYNRWDSYPEALGEMIVYQIKRVDDKTIERWIKLLERIERKYGNVKNENMGSEFGVDTFNSLEDALSEPLMCGLQIFNEKPQFDDRNNPLAQQSEWMYFIDVDNKRFSVSNGDIILDYSFKSIPTEWYGPFLETDSSQSYEESSDFDETEETEETEED